jgi:hypothetical protein
MGNVFDKNGMRSEPQLFFIPENFYWKKLRNVD